MSTQKTEVSNWIKIGTKIYCFWKEDITSVASEERRPATRLTPSRTPSLTSYKLAVTFDRPLAYELELVRLFARPK